MYRPPRQARQTRRARVGGWFLGVAAVAAVALFAPRASASEPSASPPEAASADTSSFESPRLRWYAPSVIALEPPYARVMLNLPSEWMPPPDLGLLGARGISLVPRKEWAFRRDHLTTQAVIGPNIFLRVADRAHYVDFGLRLMPRSAVAVLRFDPIAGLR